MLHMNDVMWYGGKHTITAVDHIHWLTCTMSCQVCRKGSTFTIQNIRTKTSRKKNTSELKVFCTIEYFQPVKKHSKHLQIQETVSSIPHSVCLSDWQYVCLGYLPLSHSLVHTYKPTQPHECAYISEIKMCSRLLINYRS